MLRVYVKYIKIDNVINVYILYEDLSLNSDESENVNINETWVNIL